MALDQAIVPLSWPAKKLILPTFGEPHKAETPPLNYPLVSPGKLDIENVRFEASQERLKEGE